MITIKRAQESDFDAIWQIFHEVVSKGESYSYDPETTKEQAHSLWMTSDIATYVAFSDEEIVGTYTLKPNQPGLGSHIANAAYMVKSTCSRKGVGRIMCEHSLEEARKSGYFGMQFNFVVSTNEPAVALWKKMGFSILGVVPKAYRRKNSELVDVYIMHRFL